MNLKYIIVEDAHGVETPILFPANLTHRQVAAGMGAEFRSAVQGSYIVSAGWIVMISQRDNGSFGARTSGGSDCKAWKCRGGDDDRIIERMLNGAEVLA